MHFISFLFQYGFVFGIANLAAFLFAPIFGKFGTRIGPKLLCNSGAYQGCSHALDIGGPKLIEALFVSNIGGPKIYF